MSTALSNNMRATAEAFIAEFDGDWHPDATRKYRSADCQHKMLPTSLGIPTRNNEAWFAELEHSANLIRDAKMTLDEYIGVPDERRAVCRSTLNATTPVGPLKNEYVWFFTFDESGQKITDITEIMDSQAVMTYFTKLAAANLLKDS